MDVVKREKVAEEYQSSLDDLHLNSKPLINMLTILAEENIEHADVIVNVVNQHITKVLPEVKLPVLYLVDSIIKNVKREYIQLFSQCIVNMFVAVFEKVNEKVREKMYALRQTWNDVFSTQKLYALDVRVNCIDPNWPITAKVVPKHPAIHVNPNFLKSNANPEDETTIHVKTREILELQKRKLELELEATKARLEAQEKQLADTIKVPPMQPGMPIRHNLVPIIPHGGGGHTHRNPMFHPYNRMPMPRPNMMNNMHHNFGPGSQQPMQKIRMNPVNPALVNAARQRDPRLARQQQMHQQQHQQQQQQHLPLMKSNRVEEDIRNGPSKQQQEPVKTESNSYNAKKRENRSKSSYTERPKSRDNNDRRERTSSSSLTKNGGSGSGSDGKSPTRSSSQPKSSRSGGSVSTKSKESRSSKDKTSSSSSSTSPEKKKSSSSKFLESKKDEKPTSKRETTSSSKRASRSPSLSPTKFKEFKPAIKSRNYIRKPTSPSKSPSKDVDLRSISSPDKRIKLDEETKPSAAELNTAIILPLPATKDLEQNTDTKPCMDVDLRQFQAKTPAADIITPTNNQINLEDTINSSSSNAVVKNQMDVDSDGEKKRPMADQSEEPVPKKSKSEKIDLLFGSEDVDLRTSALPHLAATNGPDVMTPPPPPIISTETEDWSKVKESTPIQNKTSKSSLEDVRAKLAKATKGQIKQKDPIKKMKQLVEQSEESQDGTDANIRTIITQAQELLESENINTDQYSTLVKTVIHLNESNKLKEAQRRESLTANNNADKKEDIENEDSDKLAREAVLKKRIPKINKDTNPTSDDKIEQNSILNRTTPPIATNEPNYVVDKPPVKTRAKASKWSAATPWEQQNQNQLKPQQQMPSNFNMAHQNAIPPPQSRGWVHNNMGPNRNFNQRGGNNNRIGIPNPWQQPAPLIFPNAAPHIPVQQQQPIQSVHAANAAQLPQPSNSIDNPQTDLVRSITIDGSPKEIRIYDNIAIVFMSPDQPREIGFKDGQRRIWIDEQEPIVLDFNADFKNVLIGEEPHRIRFGFPSRELYIDDEWYECFFGGRSIQIPIAGKLRFLKAEGPPPQVNIGSLRHDLVVGKINLIIDAHIIIPVFLDAKPQTFEMQGKTHTIQFADALKTVLIDNEPIPVEYGGLPKSIHLGENKYFVRLSALPSGLIPGKVLIKNMIRFNEEIPSVEPAVAELPPPAAAVVPHEEPPAIVASITEMPAATAVAAPPLLPTSVLQNVNIDDLFQKLISSGILNQNPAPTVNTNVVSKEVEETKTATATAAPPVVKEKEIKIAPIDLSKSETIKLRQKAIVQSIFNGMQCSSCGVRFPPEQTVKYSQHLDWHFRQNRRDRDLSRKAHSRKWYYELSDWIQYEEIEDLEEREKNWFESQQNDVENCGEESSNQRMSTPPPSCPAGPEEVERTCEVCQEKFEQFYNEELEEWHLKAAMRVDEKFYHPMCYEDYKASLTLDESAILVGDVTMDDNAVDNVIVKKEENSEMDKPIEHMDDDDDDVIVVPNEEPSIQEIPDDDEEYVPVSISVDDHIETTNIDADGKEKSNAVHNESSEWDVEIQEPNIPFTDLDTYVEKTLPSISAATDDSSESSQFVNTFKIKEEPKDDDDEDDDGFEDVGTVMVVDDVTIETIDDVSQEIISSSPSNSLPATSESNPNALTTTMDGNTELQDNNPSATTVGVNKIKINISTNIVTNNNPTGSNSTKSSELNENSSNSNYSNNISVIPVLCSGGSILTISSSNNSNVNNNNLGNKFNSDNDVINEDPHTSSSALVANQLHHKSPTPPPPQPPIEDSIEYELKPALQKIKLKKVGKVDVGLETSGLCSIM